MVPKRELQALANALKATHEYTQMARLRTQILSDPHLGTKMQNFEHEHARLIGLNLPDEQINARLKTLYDNNKAFLDMPQIKQFSKATQNYHDMIAQSIGYLNDLLDMRARP